MTHKKLGISKKAESFLRRHIRRHKRMGMGQRQAVAVAFAEAREKGFKVPRKKRMP